MPYLAAVASTLACAAVTCGCTLSATRTTSSRLSTGSLVLTNSSSVAEPSAGGGGGSSFAVLTGSGGLLIAPSGQRHRSPSVIAALFNDMLQK